MKLALGQEVYEILYKFLHKCDVWSCDVWSYALVRRLAFWTFSCLLSTSKSNLPLFLAPFGLPRISPPLQSPFRHSFSLLLDFLVPPLRLKVQSTAISRSFCTSSCLPSTSKSNPPLFLAPPRKKGGLQRNPPILIRQSQSASLNQPVQSSISQFHQVKHLQ